MIPTVAFVSLLVVGLSQGQSGVKKEWSANELDNPIDFPMSCGFSTTDPAYICDPNSILGSDIHAINWILSDAAFNSTQCPCSNYYCEHAKKPTGYRIGVALIPKMTVLKSTDGKIMSSSVQAQIFAYTLGSSKWNMGHCEEDIVVFYSVEDKTLAIYSGITASVKLTAYYKDLIAYKVGERLEKGMIVEALNHIIYDIKMVLNCDSPELSDCNLYEFSGNYASSVSSSLSFITFVTVLAMFSKYFS